MSNFTLEELNNGLDADRREELLGRFHDPFRLYSDPHAPSYVFRPNQHGEARTYADLEWIDIAAAISGRTKKKIFLRNKVARRLPNVISSKLPSTMHFIWMGTPFTEDRGQRDVATFLEPGKVGQVYLWTDAKREEIEQAYLQPGSPDERVQGLNEMATWCVNHHIRLINVDEAFGPRAPMTLQPLFNLCRLHRDWGAASDIFRYELLNRFGGGYSDVDHQCRQDLSELKNHSWQVPGARKNQRFGMGVIDKQPTMAALVATKENPILVNVIDFVRGQFTKTRRELVEESLGNPAIADMGFEAYTEAYTTEVLRKTGPNAFYVGLLKTLFPGGCTCEQLEVDQTTWDAKADQIVRCLYGRKGAYVPREADDGIKLFFERACIPPSVMNIESRNTWIARREIPTTTLAQARIALTVLAYDLVINPEMLDLTIFSAESEEFILVLQALKEKFPGLLAQVRQVGMMPPGFKKRKTDDPLPKVEELDMSYPKRVAEVLEFSPENWRVVKDEFLKANFSRPLLVASY